MSLAGVLLDVIRQNTGYAGCPISLKIHHGDVTSTGSVDPHFDHDAAAFGEILEKPSGAEAHILAEARQR